MFTQSPTRYDGWTIHLTELHGLGEVFDLPTRTALVDPTGATLEAAVTHAIGHLKMRHHLGGRNFTEAQCVAADAEADALLRASAWQLLAQAA